MPVRTGPCEWPLIACPDDPESSCDDKALTSLDATTRAAVEGAAVEWLWRWTGRRFGLCSTTLRPCYEPCSSVCDSGWSHRVVHRDDTGGWTQTLCGDGCGDGCACGKVCEVTLPGPVHDVTEVVVDGVPLLDVEFRVDDLRRLVRVPWNVRSSTVPVPFGGSGFTFDTYGQWTTDTTGWSGDPDLPTSDAAGDVASTQWPPGFVGRGQYVRMWVPPLTTVSISSPERGVTIRQTDHPNANGVGDDATGVYGGGADGTEYVIRFDGAQAVEWTSGGPGVQVREMGFYVEGGAACWPTCQAVPSPSSSPLGRTGLAARTWEVTYRFGTPVPEHGKLAAAALANELAKAVCGDSSCALPSRVQTITRQGVTMALLDEGAGMDGATGIWLVDSWVKSVVEPHRRMGSRVFSVDVSHGRRTTWEA